MPYKLCFWSRTCSKIFSKNYLVPEAGLWDWSRKRPGPKDTETLLGPVLYIKKLLNIQERIQIA